MNKANRKKWIKLKHALRKLLNVTLGIILFVILIGYAFNLSFLFGCSFILGFALSVYNGDLKHKPWKPLAIFVGALIVRIAINQYVNPIVASKTLMDLAVSALIFLSILFFGWKIKKS